MIKKLSLADLKGWQIFFDEPSKEMILIYKGNFCCVSVSDEAIDEVFELEVFSYAIKKDKDEAKRARAAFWKAMNKTHVDSFPTTLNPKATGHYTTFARLIKRMSILTERLPYITTSSTAIKIDLSRIKYGDETKGEIYGLILGVR